MYFNPYVIPYIIAWVILLMLAGQAWQYRNNRAAVPFVALALTCAFYAFFYALELSSAEINIIMFWIKIEYIFILLIPPLLIHFTITYTGWKVGFKKTIFITMLAFSLLIYVLMLTNQYHGLIYSRIGLDMNGPFPMISFEKGIFYWINTIYISTAVLAGNVLFLIMLINANRVYRGTIALMVLGSFLPWSGYIYYQVQLLPWNLDTTPLFISASALLFFFGMFRYRLFDLTPVARTRLFEDLPDGVLIIDNNLNITDLNNAAAVLFKGDNQMVGRPAAEILKEWPGMLKMIGSASDRVDFELSMENGDEKKWFRIDIIPLKEKHRSVYGQMVIISDISIRKITEEKLQLLATTDELTGLWNRRYFIKCLGDELKRMKRHNHPFSLLMVDIDYFKTVNDIFGHNTGDLSLQYLSGLMRNRLREVDLVARLGGEEFGIILPDTDLDSAQAVAENLRKIIAETPFFHDGDTINLTVSIGVTECKPDTASVEELLKLADKALYSAKNEGRNRIVLI